MSQACQQRARAPQQNDARGALAYSITSSARASSIGGISRPSALAVAGNEMSGHLTKYFTHWPPLAWARRRVAVRRRANRRGGRNRKRARSQSWLANDQQQQPQALPNADHAKAA